MAVKKETEQATAKKDNDKDREVTFEIVERIGIISESPKGWKKELNMVKWNDRSPKFDIREWDPEHEKMGRGITLTEEEAKILLDYLVNLEL